MIRPAPPPARPLSPEALALLARRAEAAAAAPPPSIARRADRSRARLTAAQQRIWLHDQLEGGAAYVRPVALRITGPLDVPALERALGAVVRRHEVLRSRLVDGADGLPELRILREDLPPLSVEGSADGADAASLRPFDLRHEPPVRVRLFREAPGRHLLLAVFHHIAFDAWSVGVYFRDLAAAYSAALHGAGAPPEPELQCGDLAEGGAGAGSDAPSATDVEYWRAAVQGVQPVLALPLDYPRRPGQPRDAERVPLLLSPDLVGRLRDLSRREGVTLFATFAAAVEILLSRYSGQDDFLLGIPVAGRSRTETHDLIGCFITTLALRADLTREPSFRELLQRVKQQSAGALAHPSVPFEHVLRLIDPTAHAASGIQVLLNFRNLPAVTPSLEGLVVEEVAMPPREALFDLDLDVTDTGSSLRGALVYPRALFERVSVGRMAAQLVMLLESAAADPAQSITSLPMLPSAERLELLHVRSRTSAPSHAATCIHHVIAERARTAPDAPAVVGRAGGMTYARLLGRAAAIAAALTELGVSRGDRVGLAVARSPDLVAAMLGVMAAGGAYVPLDPDYPDERIAFMADDAALRCVVGDRAAERRLAGVIAAPILGLDRVGADRPWTPGPAGAADPAYIIYTSGSTGTPKGVVIGHGALAAFSMATIDGFAMSAADRFLQFSTPNFDASVIEIFPTLATGGAVVLRDVAMAASAAGFLDGCVRWGVTLAVPPTAFWHELVGALADAGRTFPPSLRLMAPGGERMLPERAALWSRVAPQAELRNAYGPTETTVHATWYRVPPDFDAATGTVPIGRPNAGTRVYILDRRGALAPIGTPGELCIGGPQLAHGYLARPELTAERFTENPFAPGERVYRTGDLVRWRADGELEHLGRLDRQVKVRGFRVEIGEIESALLGTGLVSECVVEARPAPGGEQRLLAWVVPAPGAGGPDLSVEITERLRRRLPAYMLPALVPLDAIPRTPNGKLDRAALPSPTVSAPGDRERVSPRSPLEFQLVQIWERLLDVRPVGVRDDFFALGGHSLLAVRMAHALEQACGLRLPLGLLFEATTIEQLAAALIHAAAPAEAAGPLTLNPGGTRPPLIFFHGDILGAGLYCRAVAERLGPDQPVIVVAPSGRSGPPTIEAMAEAELPWIRRAGGGRFRLAGFCNGGLVAYEIARRLERDGERVELLCLIDTAARNIGLGWLDTLMRHAGSGDAEASLRERAATLRAAADLAQRWRLFGRRPAAERLRIAVRKLATLCRRAAAEANGAAPAARAPDAELQFVSRAVNAYVPQPYCGPVHLVVSSRILGGLAEARRWERSVGSLALHATPLDHQAVVTTLVPEVLRECLARLDEP